MKKFISLCIALLSFCAVAQGITRSWAAEPSAEVTAAYAAWDAAFKAADAKAIAAFYAEDALLLPANHKVFRGAVAIETFFAEVIASVKDHKLKLIEARGEGNLLYGAANWSVTAKDDAGKDKTVEGVATHIFQRQSDGKLKIKLHTFN